MQEASTSSTVADLNIFGQSSPAWNSQRSGEDWCEFG